MKAINEAGHTMEIGPKFEYGGFDEFWFVALEWKAKKRWAGGETISRKKSTDVVRVKHIDLYSGWAASADDPKTLAPFEKAVEMLHNGRIEYIVYIPDEDDDPELVKQINARLCPIELEAINGPTYSDLVRAEEAQRPSGSEELTSETFIPHLTDLVFGALPDEVELDTLHTQELAQLLFFDAANREDEHEYSEEWIDSEFEKAFKDQGQIIIHAIIGCSIRITRGEEHLTAPPYRKECDVIWYTFEKITSPQLNPYN